MMNLCTVLTGKKYVSGVMGFLRDYEIIYGIN
jgi:hypothetical protein